MAHAPYYSPRLDRDLISPLYHTAKRCRVPMTKLASALVAEGLARLSERGDHESAIIREDPPAPDPRGQKD